MSTESKTALEPGTIEALQDLIRIDLDGRRVLDEASAKATREDVKSELHAIAMEHSAYATELQILVDINGYMPEGTGTAAGTLHTILLDLRAALGGGNGAAIVGEAERTVERITDRYEHLLRMSPGSAVSDVLHRHVAKMHVRRKRLHELREAVSEQRG